MKKPVPVESAFRLNRREDKGTWGLAREDARESARNRLHGRDVQERRQDDICQGSCVELKDPSGLINSSLDRNVRRAIDIHDGDKVDEAALKDFLRAAVALNLKGKSGRAGQLATTTSIGRTSAGLAERAVYSSGLRWRCRSPFPVESVRDEGG